MAKGGGKVVIIKKIVLLSAFNEMFEEYQHESHSDATQQHKWSRRLGGVTQFMSISYLP